MNTVKCVICGNSEFQQIQILWKDLIEAWQLTPDETDYINRQQGYTCIGCGSNLRSIALASGIMKSQGYIGLFEDFCKEDQRAAILEINPAGSLSAYLQSLSTHRLVEYPAFDMMALDIPSAKYDLVIHSDTLEHVEDPYKGLSECFRVLKPGGHCVFTVPVIVDRETKHRDGKRPCYHGHADISDESQRVHSEFGADVWKYVVNAGFQSCEIYAYEYPAALVMINQKRTGVRSI